MLSVISGPDDRDRLSLPEASFDWLESLKGDIKGLRVAFSPDFGYLAVDPEVRRAATEAAEVFERELGCDVEVAHPGFVDSSDAFWALVWMESDLKGLRAMADKYEDRMTPLVLDAIRHDWKAEDFTNAVMQRKAVVNKMWRFMRKYDLLITPTLSVPAFAADVQGPEKIENRIVKPSQWMGFLYPFNLTGQPAANVPIGFTQNGLPVGLQIVGRRLDDPLVLRASAAFESVRPWRNHFPPQLTG
jgi:aspartyl-tRNA(Asn)/glutamyl-tRNA(Gln) amidotransferase subunit A